MVHPTEDTRPAAATTGQGRPTRRRTRSARAMTIYLEVADVARLLGRSAGGVRLLAQRGELRVAAKTARGSSLFVPHDVEFARLKLERQSVRSNERRATNVQPE